MPGEPDGAVFGGVSCTVGSHAPWRSFQIKPTGSFGSESVNRGTARYVQPFERGPNGVETPLAVVKHHVDICAAGAAGPSESVTGMILFKRFCDGILDL